LYSLFTILGLEENAPEDKLEAAYRHLRQHLNPANFDSGSQGRLQAEQCLLSIENAYRTLANPTARQKYDQEWKSWLKAGANGEVHPKLGQLCVAAGIITLEELESAVEKQTSLDLPLGQILQETQLISQAELDGLLLGQQLISLPSDTPHKIGQRLMALGLVTEDMVRIALIEQRTFDRKLEDLLTAHGWLDAQVLRILCEPVQSTV
jgi:hypothetical protein